MSKDNKNPLKEICPEAFFIPKYPKTFRFNLVIGYQDYGELEIRIDKGLEISNLTGSKKSLNKLEEIAKKQANKAFYISDAADYKQIYITYPFRDVGELITALAYEEVNKTKGLEEMREFIRKVKNPFNSEIFYQKTGLFLTD